MKWEVTVMRMVPETIQIEVEASSAEEAERVAEATAEAEAEGGWSRCYPDEPEAVRVEPA